MTPSQPSKGGFLKGRRVMLLGTTILSLGAAALFVAPDAARHPAVAQNVTQQAQTVQRPVGFADIVEKVKPAVISVRVKVNASPENSSFEGGQLPQGFERFFRRYGMPEDMFPEGPRNRGPRERGPRQRTTGQGSGFFISPDGYAVTNNHVVDKADEVDVQTDDGKTYTAKVIGTDPRTDLALIKVDGNNFPYAKLADKAPRIGDWVLAVGNPFGLSSTVTAGIVSARGRDIGAGPYDDFLQIDAPVNKGNSGGPTFDIDGNVVGVNTAIFSPSGGSVGIAFAIPAATVDSVVTQLKDKGSVTRGWIGVQIQPVTQDIADSMGLKNTDGALVAEPQPGSPAVKAGVKAGDVITAVNGEKIGNARELARRIGSMAPGNSVKLTLQQGGSEKTVNVTLGELPAQVEARARGGDDRGSLNEGSALGLQLAPAGSVAGSGSEGVVVTGVSPDGPAAERGFKTGDVILEVAGKAVSNPADVRKALADARKDNKRTVLMRVKSGEGTRFVALPAGRA
ncbi:Do family serine endopeptidase [Pseudorhodoplanes sinuspersici]|uniref:Probable periplasmic serine endoprotease DegP-like n=1 Tax=Pseudorhodoplanes sinuspersici TaxID=1235591 RepID=A0A1W6ZW36_9HYPH|nr:Do family serine endopeptidase [Pseudorhodoplanes sinuspersici]ARQ00975.1 serine peptidase [Pseudorhodoplanes sinuspersici]RKE72611.1 serine protease Do [Pseudorhodoplanes sinuspersici]